MESRGFTRESGVNYRFDTSRWRWLAFYTASRSKDFTDAFLVSLRGISLSRALAVSSRFEKNRVTYSLDERDREQCW